MDKIILDACCGSRMLMHGIIYGKWTFVKRGENFGIKLVKVLPKIHKLTLDMIAKDIFRPEKL